MERKPITPRTLKDYRPQHDEGCDWHYCTTCESTNNFHRQILSMLDNPHAFTPKRCSCGLDALLTSPTGEQETTPDAGFENVDGENADYVNRVTAVVREADRSFEKVGGSSRHWVRDCFLPILNRSGLFIANHLEKCRHCGEEIRQDADGDWLDRETHSTCDTPQAPPHQPEPIPTSPTGVSQAQEIETNPEDIAAFAFAAGWASGGRGEHVDEAWATFKDRGGVPQPNQCQCGHAQGDHWPMGTSENLIILPRCRKCACKEFALSPPREVRAASEHEEKNDCAELIHQVASPLAETLPRPNCMYRGCEVPPDAGKKFCVFHPFILDPELHR